MSGEGSQQGQKGSLGTASGAEAAEQAKRRVPAGNYGPVAAERVAGGDMFRSAIFERVVAASVGGLLVGLLVTPLDVVKARMQAQGGAAAAQGPVYKSTVDAFVQIVRTQGPGTLWRGLYPTLVMTVPATALYFSCYEYMKESMETKTGDFQNKFWVTAVLAGTVSRSITVTVTSPLEMIRTNMQANVVQSSSISSNSILRSFMAITRRHGVSALWGGLPPTLLRDVPFSALYWASYEWFRIRAHTRFENLSATQSFLVDFGAGALAGTVAAMVTNPFDVIKTRRQMTFRTVKTHANYGMLSIFRDLVAKDGYAGLMRGMLPRTAKVAPACAIMISSYQACKKIIDQLMTDREQGKGIAWPGASSGT